MDKCEECRFEGRMCQTVRPDGECGSFENKDVGVDNG
jgi:hypothetical protein